MCPIYFDADGNITFPSFDTVDGPDVLENFDFDSFLRDTDDTQAFGNFNFSSNVNELNDSCVTNNHGLPSASVTPLHSSACLPPPQVKMVPIELENLKLSCTTLGQDYLKQIVSIHNVCKKTVGLTYPDVLQSQLLTASRTLNKLGDLIAQHHEVVLETSVVAALEALILECRFGLGRISRGEGLAESDHVLSMRQKSIKSSELIAYGCLVPLMNMLRAFTWWVVTPSVVRWIHRLMENIANPLQSRNSGYIVFQRHIYWTWMIWVNRRQT